MRESKTMAKFLWSFSQEVKNLLIFNLTKGQREEIASITSCAQWIQSDGHQHTVTWQKESKNFRNPIKAEMTERKQQIVVTN